MLPPDDETVREVARKEFMRFADLLERYSAFRGPKFRAKPLAQGIVWAARRITEIEKGER